MEPGSLVTSEKHAQSICQLFLWLASLLTNLGPWWDPKYSRIPTVSEKKKGFHGVLYQSDTRENKQLPDQKETSRKLSRESRSGILRRFEKPQNLLLGRWVKILSCKKAV